MGYIYLLQLYPSNPDKIYKLGRTARDFIERYNDYKHDTTNPKIIFVYETDNEGKAEKDLKIIFKNKFTLRKDFGNEYFTGNVEEMKLSIMKYFMDNNIESESESENDDEDYNENEINTYEKFIQLSNINKIIITNKKK